jgi:universal stress protein A
MRIFKTILHPNDFSPLSQKALRRACDLAQEHRARLIVLHVQEPPEVIEGEFGMLPPEPLPQDETILADLERLVPANASIDVECMVAHGLVAEEIVRVAKETGTDLIVMASHGRRNLLTRWFHTNTAEVVREDAPCEVMTVESTPVETEAPVLLD